MSLNFISKPTPPDWPTGHKILDDYEVMRVLGEGGMGKVYLVRSLSTGMQFAVKRAKGLEDADRKNFLAELQTWIDIPDHPNLVSCCFFRTVEAEILIFAEYVEGGSLHDWIASRKLYEGDPDQVLERMIDVAIQLAWGLHCVHELGAIHQDVKPANVLMASDGLVGLHGLKPQVTDFGLARARAAAGEDFDPNSSILVSTIRGTPAYWSPEQSQGKPLTHQADIWSWGLSVMEIFTGEVTWMSGLGAAEILEQYRHGNEHEDGIPLMPADMADLLKECFSQDPLERPINLAYAVEKLQRLYRELIGFEYDRTLDLINKTKHPRLGGKERRTISGASWADPLVWLENALQATGLNPAQNETMVARRGSSRRGELVAELLIYDEAKQLYKNAISSGQKNLEGDLSKLCIQKALVHRAAADEHGAIQEYDYAINIRERLFEESEDQDMAGLLAEAYTNKATSISNLGDKKGAVYLYNKSIMIHERFTDEKINNRHSESLASVYTNKADSLRIMGDNHEAIIFCDKAIDIREKQVNQQGRKELSEGLASSYRNKAVVLKSLGDRNGAAVLYNLAISIYERLVNQEDRSELAGKLAGSYVSRANLLRSLGENNGALELYDKAIIIWDRLIKQDGRSELLKNLALSYINKATAIRSLGDQRGSVTFCDHSLEIYERLVNQEGCQELADELANAYMIKANAFFALGDKNASVIIYDKAIAIRERLVTEAGRIELAGDLAWLKAYRGHVLVEIGECDQGIDDMICAEKVLEEEIARTGRADLKRTLVWVHQKLEEYLL